MRRPARRAGSPQRSRLADIDSEFVAARATLDDKRRPAEAAQSDADRSRRGRSRRPRALARSAARGRQRARAHAMAEREVARNTARISALTEAKTRLTAGRDEAQRQPGR